MTPEVFDALHKTVISTFQEHFQISPNSLVDYQLYGFNNFDEEVPSIKKLVWEKTGKWLNGKYLYNKHRQWKKGAESIHFTREFVFVYFQTLGFKDITDFIHQSSLSASAIQAQVNIDTPSTVHIDDEYYVGYYLGEEAKVIYCKLIISEEEEKATIHLIYWEKEDVSSEYKYEGKILYQQNGMSLFFKNEDTLLDRSMFFGIYCERHIKVKPYLIGTISGYDRDRRPIIGEMILERTGSIEDLNLLSQKRNVNPIIAQYLSGRRYTIENKMIQSLIDLSPESRHAHIIESFISTYDGLLVTLEGEIFMITLSIKDNTGYGTFHMSGQPIYTGVFKVQASGQLILGSLTNNITKAPVSISIEVLPVDKDIYSGTLMGISRFDNSMCGRIYISDSDEIKNQLPPYKASGLTLDELRSLPQSIIANLRKAINRQKHHEELITNLEILENPYLSHIAGTYQLEIHEKSENQNGTLLIKDDGYTELKINFLMYKGRAMICEGNNLSVYMTSRNGIPHCGQILIKLNDNSGAIDTVLKASWLCINNLNNHDLKEITISNKHT